MSWRPTVIKGRRTGRAPSQPAKLRDQAAAEVKTPRVITWALALIHTECNLIGDELLTPTMKLCLHLCPSVCLLTGL